jgi:transposase
MEWSIKENRIAVVALFKCNKTPIEIFNLLKTLKITKKFVYRTIKRFNELNTIDDKPRSGRPRETRTTAAVKAVAQRIRRNPLRKQKIMAREMKIPPKTMSRIIKEDLGLGAYRRSIGQRLTDALRKIRAIRAKKLLQQYAKNGHRQILFTDEKIFTIEEKFNRQNDRVYAHSSWEAAEKIHRVERGHHPASVMVRLG